MEGVHPRRYYSPSSVGCSGGQRCGNKSCSCILPGTHVRDERRGEEGLDEEGDEEGEEEGGEQRQG